MSESDAIGAVAEPPAPPVEEEKLESTTPEEVAQVLKSSGMDIKPEKPVDKVEDAEEGDDPDAEEEPDETVEEDKAEKPKPPEKPEASQEAATDDKYSFQVEDNNGVTYKIDATANIEDVLAEFEPKNNGQIIAILDQLRTVKDLKASDDAKAADDKVAEDRRTAASQLLEDWQNEAKALQTAKRIPTGEDGDKRVNEVYKYMSDENTKRMKDGKPTLNSFEDALDKLENKEGREKVIADAKAEKERARSNGALVGGSSARASSGSPVYKVGSAKNSTQALRAMGLLD